MDSVNFSRRIRDPFGISFEGRRALVGEPLESVVARMKVEGQEMRRAREYGTAGNDKRERKKESVGGDQKDWGCFLRGNGLSN
jgi:hypothetical protein